MPDRGLSGAADVERLDAGACWPLLASRSFGRVCRCLDGEVHVALTSYRVLDEQVFLRATAYGTLARHAADHPVTLQVDDMPEHAQASWSVSVAGAPERVADPATLADLWTPVRPAAWAGSPTPVWVRLEPREVRGERRRGVRT